MIDIGRGPTVVLIPGIQGRWEWMRPAVDALARRCRVISYSLRGVGAGKVDPRLGFEKYMVELDWVLDRAGVQNVALCGVSFGGLIALHYTAHHQREHRVNALVLASTPGPAWRPDARTEGCLRSPLRSVPDFLIRSRRRLVPEMAAAVPQLRDRLRLAVPQLARMAMAPFSPRRMAERVLLGLAIDFTRDCARIKVPTLVMTGEPELDRVVSVESTREYLKLIPSATHTMLERTGHIGLVTRAHRFAEIVGEFVHAAGRRQAEPRAKAV